MDFILEDKKQDFSVNLFMYIYCICIYLYTVTKKLDVFLLK